MEVREVYEATFDAGRLTNVMGLTPFMATFRELAAGEPLRPGLNVAREEIEQWVEDCFSLEYKW